MSARTGRGPGGAARALERAAARVASRARRTARCACTSTACSRIRGAGTVVTGTLWSGDGGAGRERRPCCRAACARGSAASRCTTQPVERAEAGQRVALNLVARGEIARGDVVTDGPLAATYRVDAALEWVERPKDGARIAVHHGTRESAARLVELGGRYFQLRLEKPLVPMAGDRLVIRSLAPPNTLGGGVVIDACATPSPSSRAPSARAEPEARAGAAEARARAAERGRARARGSAAGRRARAAARRGPRTARRTARARPRGPARPDHAHPHRRARRGPRPRRSP